MKIKDGIKLMLDSATLQEIFNKTDADEIKARLEYEIKNNKNKKFAEQFSIKEQNEVVAFLCDRRKCKKCNYPQCTHTFDIRHAKNFECTISGIYEELER